MIKAKFLTLSSGEIIGFKISGHANYSSYGKDIICSAVSSAAYMATNIIIELLKIKAKVNIDEKFGFMYILVPDDEFNRCKLIFEGLKMHLILLEKAYPKYIKVGYMEV